ncbi:TIGR04283 family arsenosugar biosynthesis glycosyltransferase [Clostridium cylindrosporum]|uniref:4,4'-diaponeurosporenoate glycosyltransferase n=1 Tax=Clostridium cylindrosporum DSM 605 TaxID=1121307 RepID=A0A0J8D8V4_CLOCY|nr:TIGR04283 family arsenosugar biosynthesis glycosyltransferase [Clostridium cylindrosporum]KMT22480.1 glycosyl transferase family 2 [Clostridium cylindrosporum DSM 605]
MKFSIIVPTLNEEENIQLLLENIKSLKGDYEVIFSDGGSKDKTLSIIGDKHKIVNSKKGRANQMNTAAKVSVGEVLLFLHCDSILQKDALLKIEEKINKGYSVGCFNIAFDSSSIWMKICGILSNLRVRLRQIAFGDQGIFMKREVFYEVGGIPSLPIMEDYELSLRLRKSYRICQVDSRIKTSSRRFIKGGIFSTMWKMQRLQSMYRRGVNIEEINRMYKDVR